MQLDRLVQFHKTMGDHTRIKMIALLKSGPLHGQAIAGKLGLTPPTISYHIQKLKAIDIIYERREKNTIYFYLNEKKLRLLAESILHIGQTSHQPVILEQEKQKTIAQFFKNGSLRQLPAQRKKRIIVLEFLIKGLEKNKTYLEKELNTYIQQFHHDTATIRREFVANQFMTRENGFYQLNPEEIWPT
ncbi:DUF2087 domain-containing protein [Virgibacillus halophilus]|uniref:DUF2087 domain-containing protein n=1 Tax=Tigheibacillus halophilus TaxID=361280 RepID=UPI003638F450